MKQNITVQSWGSVLIGNSRRQYKRCFIIISPTDMRELEFISFNSLCHCLRAASESRYPLCGFGFPWFGGEEVLRWKVTDAWIGGCGLCTTESASAISPELSLRFIMLWESKLVFPAHPEECAAIYSLIQATPSPLPPDCCCQSYLFTSPSLYGCESSKT